MAEYVQALIVTFDKNSSGTNDMKKRAKAEGLKIYIHGKKVPKYEF